MSGTRLAAVETVKRSLTLARAEWRVALRLTWLPLLISSVAWPVSLGLAPLLDKSDAVAGYLVATMVDAVASSVAFLALCRLFLNRGATRAQPKLQFGKAELLASEFYIFAALSDVSGWISPAHPLVEWVVAFGLAYVSLRFFPVAPLLLEAGFGAFRRSWELTRGHVLDLLAIAILLALAVAVLWIPWGLAFACFYFAAAALLQLRETLPLEELWAPVLLILGFILLANIVGAACVCIVQRELRREDAAAHKHQPLPT